MALKSAAAICASATPSALFIAGLIDAMSRGCRITRDSNLEHRVLPTTSAILSAFGLPNRTCRREWSMFSYIRPPYPPISLVQRTA
jgi:hypothetical protein